MLIGILKPFPGSLSMLIRGGAILAIDDESEQITTDLLDLVPLDKAATSTTLARRDRLTKS